MVGDFFDESTYPGIARYMNAGRIRFCKEVIDNISLDSVRTVLDAGCGPGYTLKLIGELNSNIDLFAVDVALAAEKHIIKHLPRVHFYRADTTKLPFDDGVFDLVLCIQTLEHLKRPELALAELARVASTSGSLVLTVPDGAVDTFDGHCNFWNEKQFATFASNVGTVQIRRAFNGNLIATVRA